MSACCHDMKDLLCVNLKLSSITIFHDADKKILVTGGAGYITHAWQWHKYGHLDTKDNPA